MKLTIFSSLLFILVIFGHVVFSMCGYAFRYLAPGPYKSFGPIEYDPAVIVIIIVSFLLSSIITYLLFHETNV